MKENKHDPVSREQEMLRAIETNASAVRRLVLDAHRALADAPRNLDPRPSEVYRMRDSITKAEALLRAIISLEEVDE